MEAFNCKTEKGDQHWSLTGEQVFEMVNDIKVFFKKTKPYMNIVITEGPLNKRPIFIETSILIDTVQLLPLLHCFDVMHLLRRMFIS